MTLSRLVLPFALAVGLIACSSEPLESPDEGDDDAGTAGVTAAGRGGSSNLGRGGAGRGGASGGSSGGSAGSAPDVPDYSESPCYGESAETLVYDFATHLTTTVQATCRAEGNRTLFYVADDLWETEYAPGATPFTQADVNAFMYGYELHGDEASYRPDLGILPTDELVFGALDETRLTAGKLPVFLINSGGAGQGYLCSWCDRLELHLDGPLLRSIRSDEAFSIAAHETVHAIHSGYDENEAFWLDESLAEAAMTLNGYYTDAEWVASFLNDPNQQWGPGLTSVTDFNYGAGLLFGTFLWERGGADLLGSILRDTRNEWTSIDAALAAGGDPDDGWGLYLDMAVALYLDDPESGYGFVAFDPSEDLATSPIATGASHTATIEPYGIVYLAPESGARSISIETTDDLSARIVLSGEPAEVLDLPLGEPFDLDRAAEMLVLTAKDSARFTLSAD